MLDGWLVGEEGVKGNKGRGWISGWGCGVVGWEG